MFNEGGGQRFSKTVSPTNKTYKIDHLSWGRCLRWQQQTPVPVPVLVGSTPHDCNAVLVCFLPMRPKLGGDQGLWASTNPWNFEPSSSNYMFGPKYPIDLPYPIKSAPYPELESHSFHSFGITRISNQGLLTKGLITTLGPPSRTYRYAGRWDFNPPPSRGYISFRTFHPVTGAYVALRLWAGHVETGRSVRSVFGHAFRTCLF